MLQIVDSIMKSENATFKLDLIKYILSSALDQLKSYLWI